MNLNTFTIQLYGRYNIIINTNSLLNTHASTLEILNDETPMYKIATALLAINASANQLVPIKILLIDFNWNFQLVI